MTTPSSTSRLPRPSLARASPSSSSSFRYVSPSTSTSTSKPKIKTKARSGSHPKILPFPELSLRAQEAQRTSREGSRAASPMSSPPIDRLEVTFDQMVSMSRGGSSEGNGTERRTSGGGTGNTSAGSGLAGSTSPPVPSPLAVSAARLSRARARTAPSRARGSGEGTDTTSRESPSVTVGRSGARLNMPSPTPTSTPSRRTEGFRPASPALSRVTTNVHTTSNNSLLTTNTSTSSSNPRPVPTLLAPPTPVTPVTPAKHHTHPHTSHTTRTQSPQPPSSTSTSTSTVAIAPIPSSSHIKDHLYQSFLTGVCADVRLVVKKWGVCYHVHRMVLVQTSFFHTLFLGGFSENHPNMRRDEEWNGDDVELIFDDPNITRAAFEICLSRLYSSHPHLQFPTDLLPTAAYPLTPSFPHIPSPDYLALRSSIPHKAQLVTPRLLLSLLATTIYLGHGAFMREVLASILRTVGPLTVGRYLSFALGDGIEDEEFPGQSEEGVKALSGIAKYIQNEEDDHDREESARHGGIPIPSLRLPSRSNSMRSTHTTRDDPFSFTSTDAASLPHYYGVVGNKIGEACCCWLARWGIDLLNAELETSSPAFTIWGHGGLPAKLVRAVISSDYFFVPGEMERYCFARKVLDLRRSGWDEDNEDAAELLKTFAEGIYYPHMTFDDLSTIAADIDPSTHLPYAPLSVLQAAHWAAADLRSRVTAHEKTGSPTTVDDENELGLTQTTTAICTSGRKRRPAPRSRVPSPAIPSSSTWGHSSPSSTIDSLPSLHSSQNTVWHAVPTDGTHKIGASGLLNQASSMQFTALGDMPDFGPDPLEVPFQASSEPIEKARPPPQGERTAFGLMGDKMTGKEIQDKWVNEGGSVMFSGLGLEDGSSLSNSRMAIGNGNEERWTKIEPYRFSVEFFDVDKLTEKERFYSSTHFYAGSYFNCYVQMIKRKEKGLQLGVYLHRQSPNEPFPKPSSPRRFDSSSTTSPLNSLAPPLAPPIGGSSPVTSHTRNLSTSPMVVPGSPPTTGFSPTSNAPASSSSGNNHDGAPYTDTRSTTKAFFSISCASALGTALIRFTSGPDSFALSQSWGWKSSALKSEEYLCVPTYEAPPPREEDGDGDGVLGWSGEVPSTNGRYGQCSLRATVVVGVV
uniref:BTB domain-containing protein n=1 Tax=Kwoniella bestiolae CBS 10118 TaxID=1296100 RepID=A0A1B9GAT3_9TREE|nr:hypothetical protein I302_02977 [Kwoniella bestiolae CBS 10118]OCF28126.1 hypothetical protein I302_02977 [Kwoniella bestiolae CBS 10118]